MKRSTPRKNDGLGEDISFWLHHILKEKCDDTGCTTRELYDQIHEKMQDKPVPAGVKKDLKTLVRDKASQLISKHKKTGRFVVDDNKRVRINKGWVGQNRGRQKCPQMCQPKKELTFADDGKIGESDLTPDDMELIEVMSEDGDSGASDDEWEVVIDTGKWTTIDECIDVQ